jgi:hypothetical protein
VGCELKKLVWSCWLLGMVKDDGIGAIDGIIPFSHTVEVLVPLLKWFFKLDSIGVAG